VHNRLGDVHRIKRRFGDIASVGLEGAESVSACHVCVCVPCVRYEPTLGSRKRVGDTRRRTDVDLSHGNVKHASFDGARLGQPRHSVLGARVRRRVRSRDVRSQRAVVDDPPCGRKRRSVRDLDLAIRAFMLTYLLWASAT